MTVVFSAVSHRCIVMAADSAVTLDFGDSIEYKTGRKLYVVDGVGCVSTWGARDANTIGLYLLKEWALPNGRTVDDLARSVHGWLVDQYRPDSVPVGDVGFHVAGYLPSNQPALYHSFWNVPGDMTSLGGYAYQMIGPKIPITQFLFNGRHDLAERVINALLNEIRDGKATKFSVRTPGGLVYLAHLVMRFASELTPEVGPPFVVRVLSPSGGSIVRSLDLDRVELSEFEEWCAPLGILGH